MIKNSVSRRGCPVFLLAAGMLVPGPAWSDEMSTAGNWTLVIHGGAGTIDPEKMSTEKEHGIRGTLEAALAAGGEILAAGGSSTDAVIAAVVLMEDSPLFNAGKGAVFNAEGGIELDASIMDGRNLQAGAVAGVTRVRNPIVLARAVMDHSKHVMLMGDGAEAFAIDQEVELVDPEYFRTPERWEQLQRARASEDSSAQLVLGDKYYGTVGAVARDQGGNLAAGTSTGGLTNKRYGRVGDSPIIGAGTYASNDSCAVSGTGQGEYFIRATVAREICALVEIGGLSLAEAAHRLVQEQLVEMGGEGGIIAIDADGNHVLEFNTTGMYRGWLSAGGEPATAIYVGN